MDPVEAGLLIDFYGNLLTQRNRLLLELHYSEDMSLSEIADNEGISRQAVYDAVHRGTSQLVRYEEKLGLVARFMEHKSAINDAVSLLESGESGKATDIIRNLYDRL